MSTTLFWRPTHQQGNSLSNELKRVLMRNPSSELLFNAASAEDMGYLQGLIDADIDGAKQLMALVKKHGRITLWEDS